MAIVDFDTECWDDPWVQMLPPFGKLLFIYLWTNPHRNISGIYTISVNTISFETKLTPKQIKELWPILDPKVKYDSDHSVCWVMKHARRQFLRSGSIAPKQRTGIRRHALKFKWHPFFLLFIRAYPEIFTTEDLQNFLNFSFKNEDDSTLTRRQILWVRDEGKCQYCGEEIIEDRNFEIDHIIPLSRNGPDRYDNLALACNVCNKNKSDRIPEEAELPHPKAFPFNKSLAIQKLMEINTLRIRFIEVFGEETLSKGLKPFERLGGGGKGGGLSSNGYSVVKEKNNSPNPDPDSDALKLSTLLFSLIRERDPKAKPPNLQKWALHVDRLIRIDQRTPEEIETVIRWCQQDDFWQDNILSAEKLRKQFIQLNLKMNKIEGHQPEDAFDKRLAQIKKIREQQNEHP